MRKTNLSFIVFVLVALFLALSGPVVAQQPIPTMQGVPLGPMPPVGQPIPTAPPYPPTWIAPLPPTPIVTWTPLPTVAPPIFRVQLVNTTDVYDAPSFDAVKHQTMPGDQGWPIIAVRPATAYFYQVMGDVWVNGVYFPMLWYSGRYIPRTAVLRL